MKKKEEEKKTLKLNLLFMDIITIIIFFIGVIFLFEYIIKEILIKNSINKFSENIKIVQFDLINSISYIEEKKEMPYEENVDKIFEYLKLSSLKRSKYDESLFLVVFPKEYNKVIIGKRNDLNIKYDFKEDEYNIFKNKIDSSTRDKIASYIDFDFQGKKYIGIAELSKLGIKKEFKIENIDTVYPIIIIADRSDEFFFIINRIRNIFLIALFIIFGIVAYIKLKNTIIATKEIKATSDSISDITNEIRTSGIVQSETKRIDTKFRETSNLDNSFNNLAKSLVSVGDIISGIADRDLFTATLKNDKTLLSPHDEIMAVMFLDIQGFTTIAERNKDNIMTIVNSIWKNVEKVIGAKNGKINKYMGDSCLVIFRDSDNKSGNQTALNAFNSIIELIEIVPEISKKLDVTFNFRIGLDYGKVTYGKTGTDNNYELGVIGDPVNTASRLEALNKQYHTNFLITDTAFNKAGLSCQDDLKFADSKNKNIELKCFRIDRARPKGKKEAKELFTVLKKNQKDQYSFIGSDKTFNIENFEYYEKIINTYLNSIKYWQEYVKSKDKSKKIEAENNWINLIHAMGNFYYKIKFPPLENFIKSLVKIEEYDEFNTNPENWLKKKTYNIKEPSLEWIKLGTNELEK